MQQQLDAESVAFDRDLHVATPSPRRFYFASKRLLDIALALALLALSLPVWLLAAVLIRLTSPGPVLYRHERCGQGGRVFICYKFRTMCRDAEQQKGALRPLNEMSGPVFKITNDPRVTSVGRRLRKTSVDELPQLINVLLGQMSIVGPRPPLPEEVQQYGPYELARLSVKPGLTCIWQVSGRSMLDFQTWVALDRQYIQRRTLWLDLLIIVRTIPAVITARGAC